MSETFVTFFSTYQVHHMRTGQLTIQSHTQDIVIVSKMQDKMERKKYENLGFLFSLMTVTKSTAAYMFQT
jgi:hypothetical protein